MLLTTAAGQCIRFRVDDVRVFKGRDSTGVRGITLAEGDQVISMAILRHVDATPEERAAYLKMRRAVTGEAAGEERGRRTRPPTPRRPSTAPTRCRRSATPSSARTSSSSSPCRENGYGKRTSSYEYRVTGRGGKGIVGHGA